MADQDIPLLDKEIVLLPDDIRNDLAERGRRDLYFFAKAILGYSQMTIKCHGPLCVFHDQHPSRFKLSLYPRGHYKTSVLTIAKNAQRVVKDSNQRILIINEVADNSENFLSAIAEHFEQSPILRTLYSSVIPKKFKTWSSKELLFNRTWRGPEPTISAMGMTSALTSRHYTHITIDDPISEEAVKSEGVMNDAITRIDKVISLMVNPEQDTFDLTGTRWALHDVYSAFMKKYGDKMARFIRGAIDEAGQPIFPELISLETLAQARRNMGEYAFSCLYMNNPRDIANQDFNVQDLKFWRWTTDESKVVTYDRNGEVEDVWDVRKLDITVSVDLAVSEKVTSDRNAIVTCGITPKGQAIVLDVWAQRCTPLEVIERLFWLKARFQPRVFGIEGVAYQKAFKYFLRAECERRGTYMNIEELKAIPSRRGTGNNSKEMRIRGLQPIAATGRLYVSPQQHTLRNEMADFPLGEHDDCLDALAHQLTMWRGFLSPERMERYRKSEQRLLQRAVVEQQLPRWETGARKMRPQDVPHPDDLGIEIPRFSEFQSVRID